MGADLQSKPLLITLAIAFFYRINNLIVISKKTNGSPEQTLDKCQNDDMYLIIKKPKLTYNTDAMMMHSNK